MSSQGVEPCKVCGENTAVGSILYSDRRVIGHADGHRNYICTLCDQRIAASRHGKQLTDDETRRLIETGSLSIKAAGRGL